MIFDYVVAILEMCKLIRPHGRSSLVPPHFAIPMSYTSYMPNLTMQVLPLFWLLTSQLGDRSNLRNSRPVKSEAISLKYKTRPL